MNEEYRDKWIIFGAGFMPEASDAQSIFSSNALPESAPQPPRGMIPFMIEEEAADEESLINYADYLLHADGEGCALDADAFDFVLLEMEQKKCIVAWATKCKPEHKYSLLKSSDRK